MKLFISLKDIVFEKLSSVNFFPHFISFTGCIFQNEFKVGATIMNPWPRSIMDYGRQVAGHAEILKLSKSLQIYLNLKLATARTKGCVKQNPWW